MKIILQKESKKSRADCRNDACIICGEDCNPHYRFLFHSKEEDIDGNSIIDNEISCCDKCYSKVLKMF